MLPSASEVAVILGALARIARRAAQLEAEEAFASQASFSRARRTPVGTRSTRPPWPTVIAHAKLTGNPIPIENAVYVRETGPDDFEEELLRQVDANVEAPTLQHVGSRPWTTQTHDRPSWPSNTLKSEVRQAPVTSPQATMAEVHGDEPSIPTIPEVQARPVVEPSPTMSESSNNFAQEVKSSFSQANTTLIEEEPEPVREPAGEVTVPISPPPTLATNPQDAKQANEPVVPASSQELKGNVESSGPEIQEFADPTPAPALTASKVPSSRIGRLFHYGSLGAGLAFGAAGSFLSGGPAPSADGKTPPRWMSESNIRLLVNKLSTMRGAALKLGQFMSIQDSHILPPELEQVLMRVQNSAHYMPGWQFEKVMRQELGTKEWREKWFEHFEEKPFAAASIGQVHLATLRDDLTQDQLGVSSEAEAEKMRGQKVAVKVQFPGVKESIKSDLSYLKWLVSASSFLPKGLFLENTLRVMERELEDECDYEREAEMNRRFRKLVETDEDSKDRFAVPRVFDALSTGRVLTTEMMHGTPLTKAIPRLDQSQKNAIATSILELSLRELFRWRLMQTDPNWTNFLWNAKTQRIELIDFGATREYSKKFMDLWLKLLTAAMQADREGCRKWSLEVGYLTGDESETMLNAHLESMIALGEPFRSTAPSPYPFTNQTITSRVRDQIPVMLRERLTPPPSETYSLNRKLSGAFLLCSKLGAEVQCRDMMDRVTRNYRFGEEKIQPSMPSLNGVRGFHTTAIRGNAHLGRNLRDRWPRSIEKALEGSSVGEGDVVTLSPTPTGAPSIGAAPQDGSSILRKEVGAEQAATQAPTDDSEVKSQTSSSGSGSYKQAVTADVIIHGIKVPRRPAPPGPEDCCMSGCARCVYDLYAEDLQDYHGDLSEARAKLLSSGVTKQEWDEELLGAFPSESQPGKQGADHKATAESEVDSVIAGLDPSMKAFLEMERRMKKKAQAASASA